MLMKYYDYISDLHLSSCDNADSAANKVSIGQTSSGTPTRHQIFVSQVNETKAFNYLSA